MKDSIYFKEANLKSLFINSIKLNGETLLKCKYVIPDFQRSYVWKIENINKLIKSIQDQKTYNYYGNIVIYSSSKGSDDYIIDGQQRFISLSLILKILEKRCSNKKTKENFNKLLIREDSKPKITFLNNENNLYYKSFLNDNTFVQSNLFSKKINKITKQIENNEYLKSLNTNQKLDEFLKKILKMNFVVIVCDDLGKAYSLFDSLNSTGIALTSSEKVKNAFLSKANEFSKDKKHYKKVSNIWKKIEKDFEGEDISLFNRFFRHQWYLREGKVSEKQLYSRFEKGVIEKIHSFESVDSYIKEIEHNAKIYLDVRSQNPQLNELPSQENRIHKNTVINYIRFINLLNLEQIYPVILALYKFGLDNKNYFKSGTFREHIKKFWLFSLLAKYGDIVPNKYETKFANLCFRKDKENPRQYINRIEKFIKEEMYEILKHSNKKFKSNFAKEYNDSLQKSAFDILYYINDLQLKESTLTLEHIIPQGREGQGSFVNWSNISEKEYKEISKYIFNIGNITILEKKLEKSCENKSFDDKKKIYSKSKILMNRKIINYNFNNRSLKNVVLKRGEDVSQMIFDLTMNIIKK